MHSAATPPMTSPRLSRSMRPIWPAAADRLEPPVCAQLFGVSARRRQRHRPPVGAAEPGIDCPRVASPRSAARARRIAAAERIRRVRREHARELATFWRRCVGSFSRQRSTVSLQPGRQRVRAAAVRLGADLEHELARSVSASNGGRPASIWYITTPIDQMSLRGSVDARGAASARAPCTSACRSRSACRSAR